MSEIIHLLLLLLGDGLDDIKAVDGYNGDTSNLLEDIISLMEPLQYRSGNRKKLLKQVRELYDKHNEGAI